MGQPNHWIARSRGCTLGHSRWTQETNRRTRSCRLTRGNRSSLTAMYHLLWSLLCSASSADFRLNGKQAHTPPHAGPTHFNLLFCLSTQKCCERETQPRFFRCDFFGQIALFFFVNHIFWTVTVVECTYYYVTGYVKDYQLGSISAAANAY